MRVDRILNIKNTGILRDFNGDNLPNPDLNFKDINLIFGWNGTGKTTLSRVLRCYELGELCKKLEDYPTLKCEIQLQDGVKLSETDFAKKQQIRIFNKDFIEENIFQPNENDGGNITLLYYLGKENIELARERIEKDEKRKEQENLETNLDSYNKKKDKLAKDIAKEIKDTLLGIKKFQHYSSTNFLESFSIFKEQLTKENLDPEVLKLSDDDFGQKLKTIKNLESLQSWIEEVKNNSGKIDSPYIQSVTELLGKSVSVQKTIEKLKEDWELSKWVQEGINIHKTRHADHCEFCGQEIPTGRIEDLEQHFNEEYTALVELVDTRIIELTALKIKEYSKIPNEDTKKLAESFNALISRLLVKLEEKQKNILTGQSFQEEDQATFIREAENINSSIDDISVKNSTVAEELQTAIIARHFSDYDQLENDIKNHTAKIAALDSQIKVLEKTIIEGEQSVRNFKLPAERINSDLERFLGHSELKFEDKKDGYGVHYEIKRNEKIASNLSEGEKTAVSLIYFLRKLAEDGFDLSKGLVFIDDPISSMDSQFLYSAYAFIVAVIENETGETLRVGQFFLSTHNYDFFNLFKKKYSNNPRRCQMYMLKNSFKPATERESNIYDLDPLLKKFNSDYQYLYSRLIEFQNTSPEEQGSLERIYYYPNIGRRVLETFLSFRFPRQADLQGKINMIKNPEISKETKESVYRFINIQSHGTLREVQGFSAEILEPSAKDHVLDILKIMNVVDPEHCAEMTACIPA